MTYTNPSGARVIYHHRPNWRAPVGSAAHELKHGQVLPLGTVLPIERVRRPLLARLFGGKGRG